MKYIYIAGGLLSIFLLIPSTHGRVSAENIDGTIQTMTQTTANPDAQSQIQALIKQIEILRDQIDKIRHTNTPQEDLHNLSHDGDFGHDAQTQPTHMWDQASSTSMFGTTTPNMQCFGNRKFKIGDHGDDVKQLQNQMGVDSSVYSGKPTGYFGNQSQKAFLKFKRKMGDKICHPYMQNSSQNDGQNSMKYSDMKDRMDDHQDIHIQVGTTTAINMTSISIMSKDGSTQTFSIASSTIFQMFVAGSEPKVGLITDISIGDFVRIHFKKNQDGNMLAVHIMKGIPQNPPFMQGRSQSENSGDMMNGKKKTGDH